MHGCFWTTFKGNLKTRVRILRLGGLGRLAICRLHENSNLYDSLAVERQIWPRKTINMAQSTSLSPKVCYKLTYRDNTGHLPEVLGKLCGCKHLREFCLNFNSDQILYNENKTTS